MSLFQTDGFPEKLTRVELKKHFLKKKIVSTLYLQGQLALSEIMKGLDVSAPTLQNLIDKLQMVEISRYNDKNSDILAGTKRLSAFLRAGEKWLKF